MAAPIAISRVSGADRARVLVIVGLVGFGTIDPIAAMRGPLRALLACAHRRRRRQQHLRRMKSPSRSPLFLLAGQVLFDRPSDEIVEAAARRPSLKPFGDASMVRAG